MMVERTIRITALPSELPLERVKTALKHAAADIGDQFRLALGDTIELRRPLGEGPLTIGDRRERNVAT